MSTVATPSTSTSTGTTTTSTTTRVLRLLALVVTTICALALSMGAAHAYIGESKTLPSTSFATGSVKVTNYGPSGTATYTYRGGGRCVYIQAKHTAVAGVDGTWGRLTSNNCGGTKSVTWSKTTSSAYNGIKFRLCQDVPYYGDTCGADTNIGTSY